MLAGGWMRAIRLAAAAALLPGSVAGAADGSRTAPAGLEWRPAHAEARRVVEELRSEVEVMKRIAAAQRELRAWNEERARLGLGGMTLRSELCLEDEIRRWCRLFPATFGVWEDSVPGTGAEVGRTAPARKPGTSAPAAPAGTGKVWPAPEVAAIVDLEAPHAVAYAMRAALGDTGEHVGLGVICAERGPYEIEATVFFGGFPADRRPVQLAVRGADGTVERFGPVVTAGPESGFHSPRIVDAGEAERFANAALRPGALVSNGYRSFRNRAGEARNREVREAFLACLRRPR